MPPPPQNNFLATAFYGILRHCLTALQSEPENRWTVTRTRLGPEQVHRSGSTAGKRIELRNSSSVRPRHVGPMNRLGGRQSASRVRVHVLTRTRGYRQPDGADGGGRGRGIVAAERPPTRKNRARFRRPRRCRGDHRGSVARRLARCRCPDGFRALRHCCRPRSSSRSSSSPYSPPRSGSRAARRIRTPPPPSPPCGRRAVTAEQPSPCSRLFTSEAYPLTASDRCTLTRRVLAVVRVVRRRVRHDYSPCPSCSTPGRVRPAPRS